MMHRFFLIFLLLLPVSATAQDDARIIAVTGLGTFATSPDQAMISLGVESYARTAREALSANSESMTTILDTLKAEGIADKDVQTTGLSLFPQFENRTPNRPPAVIGYTAQNMVRVTVKDLDALGSILDQVSQAGGNRINSIQFGLQDTKTPKDEARRLAVKDAMDRAQLYADAANLTLGQIMTMSDASANVSPMGRAPMARAEAMMSDVPIAQGELTITAHVNVVFAIE